MQIHDLVTPIDKLTDEELLERLRAVRHNREVVRPAARKRAEAPEKKASKARLSATTKLLSGLSDAERAALMEQLSKDHNDNQNGSSST